MNHRFIEAVLFHLLFLGTTLFATGSGQVLDLKGNPTHPLEIHGTQAVVFIFLATDCPISNRYAPVINRIYERYHAEGITFYAVYPMESDIEGSIETHRKDFAYTMPALIDRDHILVNSARATVTPEVAVYVPDHTESDPWVYCGRIDDLYVDFGKWRRAPSSNDLTDILDKILAGVSIKPKRTRAVGCYIAN